MIDFQPITARIFVEGTVVGVLLIIFTWIVSFILHSVGVTPILPDICKTWNDGHIMEITLFLSGLLFHLTFELFGWNKLYAIDKVSKL
jgi:hypothetical protein